MIERIELSICDEELEVLRTIVEYAWSQAVATLQEQCCEEDRKAAEFALAQCMLAQNIIW